MISKLNELYGKDSLKIVLEGNLTQEFLDETKKYIRESQKEYPERRVILIITTGGGDAIAAYNFYQWIKAWEINLVAIAVGTVFSAGVTLYLAGAERKALRNSIFSMHAVSISGNKLTAEELRGNEQQLTALTRAQHKIFKKNLKLSNAKIDTLLSPEGGSFTADEAKKINLVHEII